LKALIILTKYGNEEENDWAIFSSTSAVDFDSEAPLKIQWSSTFPLLFGLAASEELNSSIMSYK
jgi:hypothetical protein